LNKKKIVFIIFLVLLLFAGIIALTQELDFLFDFEFPEDNINISQEWIKQPSRWFRSNIGGMALEEIHTRFIALRNEYALSIEFIQHDNLPEFLSSYYENNFLIEIRTLFKNRNPIRTQWLFRDIEKNTRVNAVFVQSAANNESQTGNRTGFVEIFDEKMILICEYRFYDDGGINKIDYEYNEELLISASVQKWDDGENYQILFTDYYRYNLSLSLRSIERIFYTDMLAGLNDPVLISFPRYVIQDNNSGLFVTERLNLYPEFFEVVSIVESSRIIYDTDSRGRVLVQTYFNESGIIEWVIRNTWQDNRIISTVKIEGDITQLAEYEYNAAGDRILERNYTNGVLERLVRAEGNTEIEELFMNNTVVLRAIWEDGVKVSEVRVRN